MSALSNTRSSRFSATSSLNSTSSTSSGLSSTSSLIARRRAERLERDRERGALLAKLSDASPTSASIEKPPSSVPISAAKHPPTTPTHCKDTHNEGKEEECIGFATLPDQIHRKVIKKGFHFTIMVVGESGLGKSTLINSLFMTDLYKDRKPLGVEDKIDKTVSIEMKNLDIEEGGVKLRVTIIDTPGFSDSLNGENSIRPVENYLDDQFDKYFQAESGINRKNILDTRVHCLLYFISPYGHGLSPMDVECLRRLHDKVNIIPLIAKADTLTQPEILRHKNKVLQDLKEHGIRTYEFPECDQDEDEEFKRRDEEMKEAIPFAVVGSNVVTEVHGKKVRARIYPWGIVEVENESHSDFCKLRRMLIGTHLQDLKDVTEDLHYENYRARYIQSSENNNLPDLDHTDRQSAQLSRKESQKVEQLLHEKEEEIKKMQAMLAAMQRQMATSVI